MTTNQPIARPRLRTWLCWLIAFVVAFDLAFAWQKLTGAYDSEFGGHPDEAAHYVTGLFMHDAIGTGFAYARGGFHGSPVKMGKEFADGFYPLGKPHGTASAASFARQPRFAVD